ncbi:hypothetical protein B0J18DRAFT_242634 [Chaetomium sp. MPI-SDFR-AT-0129]|nr:hypothetical protein B0J18DRAFT_242634 [Chaetomium sp. MPI-SDFR-AT-0129]
MEEWKSGRKFRAEPLRGKPKRQLTSALAAKVAGGALGQGRGAPPVESWGPTGTAPANVEARQWPNGQTDQELLGEERAGSDWGVFASGGCGPSKVYRKEPALVRSPRSTPYVLSLAIGHAPSLPDFRVDLQRILILFIFPRWLVVAAAAAGRKKRATRQRGTAGGGGCSGAVGSGRATGRHWGLVRRWLCVLFPLPRSASRALVHWAASGCEGLSRCGHRSGEPGLVLGCCLRKADRRSDQGSGCEGGMRGSEPSQRLGHALRDVTTAERNLLLGRPRSILTSACWRVGSERWNAGKEKKVF